MIEEKNELENLQKANEEKTFQKSKDNTPFYYDFVRKTLNKVHVMRLEQLLKIMQVKYTFPREKCLEIVLDAQKDNYLFVSKDGYVLTRGFYLSLTGDKFSDSTELSNYEHRICFNIGPELEKQKGLINCLTVVANMMPISEDFFIPNEPWNVMFITPESFTKPDANGQKFDSCLYQLIYIPHVSIGTYCSMLERFKEEEAEAKKRIKRIAVVEKAEDAPRIPYVGFTNIVTVKEDNFKIIESRKDNPWRKPTQI